MTDPKVLLPVEVVKLLRLDEVAKKDGTVRKRAMSDALRSLDYLAQKNLLLPLAGNRRRYARVAVMRYLEGETPDEENLAEGP